MSKTDEEATTVHPTGAMRTNDGEGALYHLLPHRALKRVAKRYGMGAVKRGRYNWEQGLPFSDTYDHAFRHLTLWASGDRSDDHLAAAAWGLLAMLHFEELGRTDLMDMHPCCETCGRRVPDTCLAAHRHVCEGNR